MSDKDKEKQDAKELRKIAEELAKARQEFEEHEHVFDAMFKLTMKEKKNVIDYLKKCLPTKIVTRALWKEISYMPTNFLAELIPEKSTDLLLMLPYREKGKASSLYIYILFDIKMNKLVVKSG